MVNHPNRGPRTASSTPTPAEILAARHAAGLTQTEAARLIHTSLRAWQQWEAGDRRMHPAFFELWNLKVNQFAQCIEWCRKVADHHEARAKHATKAAEADFRRAQACGAEDCIDAIQNAGVWP